MVLSRSTQKIATDHKFDKDLSLIYSLLHIQRLAEGLKGTGESIILALGVSINQVFSTVLFKTSLYLYLIYAVTIKGYQALLFYHIY